MALAIVHSRAQAGVEAPPVTVEVHLAGGLPSFSIVGLPEMAVKEARDRVRCALQNSGFDFPQRRIICSLAPAELPKAGGRYDLPIAIGILAASGQVPTEALARHEFLGELALTGELRGVRGTLPAALTAREAGRALVVPEASAAEAGLARDAEVLSAAGLLQVTGHLNGGTPLSAASPPRLSARRDALPDLASVIGQHRAKRALEVAAAGAHNILFTGPPGTGKSMLAARLPGILPPMSEAEALEAAAAASVSRDGFDPALWGVRPFRSPHHTASAVALVGGGSPPRPGEISLAHCGVLFLDELPEFQRRVLEVLREPLEAGAITISRAAQQARFPARFQLVAAMNPCPCGHLGDPSGRCHCSPEQVHRYRSRVSGPLLDRIDLHVEVPRQSDAGWRGGGEETSATVAARVRTARERQRHRQGCSNSRIDAGRLQAICQLPPDAEKLLARAVDHFGLSLRGRHRTLKLARTIADLAGEEQISEPALAEAISYRQLDRRSCS